MYKITAVDVGMCLPKCFVILVNIFTFLLGSLIVGFSAWGLANVGDVLRGSALTAFLYGPMGFGIFIVIISFFGCCGACFKNRFMLMTFAVLLFVILVIQVVIVSIVYSGISSVNKSADDALLDTIKKAKTDELYLGIWDVIQSSFKCCGVNSPNDWNSISDHLPQTCCKLNNGTTANDFAFENSTCTQENAFPKGCKAFVTDYIEIVTNPLLAGIIVVLIIQFANIVFSCCMFFVYGRKSQNKSYQRTVHNE